MTLNTPLALAVAIVVTVGASAATVVAARSLWTAHGAVGDRQALSLGLTADSAATSTPRIVARPPTPTWPNRVAVPRATLRAEVLVADQVHDANLGRLALPSGTRLNLRLTASRSGMLEVHALNSLGERAALWSTDVVAGTPVETPRLVMEGQRGLETLEVTLRSAGGEPVVRRSVQVWHE